MPRDPGIAAPGDLAVVREGFREAHADAGADRGGHADEKCIEGVARGEGRREDRGERRDRSVDEPRETGLDDLEHEQTPRRRLLLVPDVGRGDRLAETGREALMLLLDFREIAQEFADFDIARLAGGLLVKMRCLELHRLGHPAHGVDPDRVEEPDRIAAQEAPHVLPGDVGQRVAELGDVEVQERVAVRLLLLGHFFEDPGRRREVALQAVRELKIDSRILFLVGDGQGQDLGFGQIAKALHGSPL